jgi:phosphatidate cytidylyltransferase
LSELIKRVLVALIGIPFAFFVIYKGGWLLFIVIAIISLISLWEFYGIQKKKHSFPNYYLGLTSAFLFLLIIQLLPFINSLIISFLFFIIFLLAVLMFELWRNKPNNGLNISVTIAGFYIPISFSFVILIRELFNILNRLQNSSMDFISIDKNFYLQNDSESALLLISILISIWICDTAAYFVGKLIGRHKLFERISPKKTWEGAVAGFIFGILAFWGATEILLNNFPILHVLVIGAIVGIIGQIGDLAESQIKRDAGIKDSSTIIPGHGGFLDRFDSIIFVFPAVFIYLFLNSITFN